MARGNRSHLTLAIALTAVAGWVDAIGFLRLGHFFVSYMSGDSTQLAVSSLSGKSRDAAIAGTIVILFLAGVVVGRLLLESTKARGVSVVLLTEALLLSFGATAASSTVAMIVSVVIAMGIQNAAIDKKDAAGLGLSYVTGSLVSLGDRLADALRSGDRADRWAWMPVLLHWLGLVLGAACGTVSYRAWDAKALLVPAAITATLAAATAVRVPRGPAP